MKSVQMDRWPRRAKNKPEGWLVNSVPMDLFQEWLKTPGLEEELKSSMKRSGLPDDAQIIVIPGEERFGYSDIWLHPIAAHKFGLWYASKLDEESPHPAFGVLYAAIYDNGLTKIGMTKGPGEKRLSEHDSMMALTGGKPVEHIIVECKARPNDAEDRLVQAMAARYEQKRREWFVCNEPAEVRRLMEESIEKDWQKKCRSAKVS